jgi:hypothetical protein
MATEDRVSVAIRFPLFTWGRPGTCWRLNATDGAGRGWGPAFFASPEAARQWPVPRKSEVLLAVPDRRSLLAELGRAAGCGAGLVFIIPAKKTATVPAVDLQEFLLWLARGTDPTAAGDDKLTGVLVEA